MRAPLTARRVLALTCVSALGLMGGCASPSTSTEDTGPEATTATATSEPTQASGPNVRPTCALAPASLIKETLNADVSGPAQVSADTSVECTYLSGIGGHTVIVRFKTDQDAASFANDRRESDNTGEPTSDVSGVGDEAYQSSVEFGDTVTNTMVARKGTMELQVISAASVDREKALLTKLFAALT
jgi:hypothetical protein